MKTDLIKNYPGLVDPAFMPAMNVYRQAEIRDGIRKFSSNAKTIEYAVITIEEAKGLQPIPGRAFGIPIPDARYLMRYFRNETLAAIERGHYLLFVVQGDIPESAYDDAIQGAFLFMKNPNHVEVPGSEK